jgi:SAM-dependent methyltransferase
MKIKSQNEATEIKTIVNFAKNFPQSSETYPLYHIDSPYRVKRYVDKVKEIKRYLSHGKILDWGSGYGQMLFLLHNRGFDVIGCELTEHYKHGTLADVIGQKIVYLSDPVKLPFENSSFHGMLSCGVLEHVANPEESLKEIKRVLKKGGYFFIYHLPNKFSWIEFMSHRILNKGHERLYKRDKTVEWLKAYNFKVLRVYYESFMPLNMGFVGDGLRRLVDNPLYSLLNDLLPRVPVLKYFSQNITIICQR